MRSQRAFWRQLTHKRSPINLYDAGLASSVEPPSLSVVSSDGSDRNQRSASDRRTIVRRPSLRAISRPAVISS
jgi:hypothetical protein